MAKEFFLEFVLISDVCYSPIMESLNHKIFVVEEFFGSRIYNTKDQEEYFFDKEATTEIKKIFSGNYENTSKVNEVKNGLVRKGLLTSNIVYIKNKKSSGLSSPLRVSLNITRKCNLKCKSCFTDSGNPDPNELTAKELFDLIDQMKMPELSFWQLAEESLF